jgi:RNA polymerase sigma-70 factor (ECF subfamily)
MSEPAASLHTEQLPGLLTRLREGDRGAADELIRGASDRLNRLARQMLRRFPLVRTQEQTSDVLQESSLRLLAALRQATPPDTRALFALAGRHIRFHLLDLARRCRRGAPRPLDEHEEPAAAGEEEDLERWEELHEAVERLPDELREVFGLRFYHGWRWEDIAGLLEVNERTVRRRWLRAGVALEAALGGRPPSAGPEPPDPR